MTILPDRNGFSLFLRQPQVFSRLEQVTLKAIRQQEASQKFLTADAGPVISRKSDLMRLAPPGFCRSARSFK